MDIGDNHNCMYSCDHSNMCFYLGLEEYAEDEKSQEQ